MKNLRSLETNELIDMLAVHTTDYLKLGGEMGKEEEYSRTVLTIKAIQAEIDNRKRTPENTSITNPGIVLP